MKHTKVYTLWGNMYASDGVYLPDEITSGSYVHCCCTQDREQWIEYNGTYITAYDSKTDKHYDISDDEFYEGLDEDTPMAEIYDAFDLGPGTRRIINGKECVYWTDGMWISRERVELDERPA